MISTRVTNKFYFCDVRGSASPPPPKSRRYATLYEPQAGNWVTIALLVYAIVHLTLIRKLNTLYIGFLKYKIIPLIITKNLATTVWVNCFNVNIKITPHRIGMHERRKWLPRHFLLPEWCGCDLILDNTLGDRNWCS